MISLNPAKLNRCDWFIIAWVHSVQYYFGDMSYVCISVLGYALATYKKPNFE